MNISVIPLSREDRDRAVEIARLQSNFLECEITIAVEVIDGSLSPAGDYQTLVARDGDGQIWGFVCFGAVPLTENRYDLYWIAVDPGAGRAGIGSRLLHDMEARLSLKGSGHIYIDTSSTGGYTAARSFYEKHGYRAVARLEDFYRAGDDKIIYRKIF